MGGIGRVSRKFGGVVSPYFKYLCVVPSALPNAEARAATNVPKVSLCDAHNHGPTYAVRTTRM